MFLLVFVFVLVVALVAYWFTINYILKPNGPTNAQEQEMETSGAQAHQQTHHQFNQSKRNHLLVIARSKRSHLSNQ